VDLRNKYITIFLFFKDKKPESSIDDSEFVRRNIEAFIGCISDYLKIEPNFTLK
jgi:hypothetical protein